MSFNQDSATSFLKMLCVSQLHGCLFWRVMTKGETTLGPTSSPLGPLNMAWPGHPRRRSFREPKTEDILLNELKQPATYSVADRLPQEKEPRPNPCSSWFARARGSEVDFGRGARIEKFQQLSGFGFHPLNHKRQNWGPNVSQQQP